VVGLDGVAEDDAHGRVFAGGGADRQVRARRSTKKRLFCPEVGRSAPVAPPGGVPGVRLHRMAPRWDAGAC
jgi:hypothetical protein